MSRHTDLANYRRTKLPRLYGTLFCEKDGAVRSWKGFIATYERRNVQNTRTGAVQISISTRCGTTTAAGAYQYRWIHFI